VAGWNLACPYIRTEAAGDRTRLPWCAALFATALLLGGCSISLPVSLSKMLDPEPTSSVAKPERPLPFAQDFSDEDWRRARSAMGVALDPQGNGSRVSWDNPESGLKGHFEAAGIPFVKGDEICRPFRTHYTGPTKPAVELRGAACRPSGGEWSLADVQAAKAER
jgi:hypothetical protein